MLSKKKIQRKRGTLFWITGLSGSGKTTLANLIVNDVEKNFGPTILLNGNDLRNIFGFDSYKKKSRLLLAKKYSKLCKYFNTQGFNVVIAVVGLFHKIHKLNRKIHKNYIEIYIKADLKKLKKNKSKFFYKHKTNNVWGIDLKPEFPKKPHFVVNNTFDKPIKHFAKKLLKRINLL